MTKVFIQIWTQSLTFFVVFRRRLLLRRFRRSENVAHAQTTMKSDRNPGKSNFLILKPEFAIKKKTARRDDGSWSFKYGHTQWWFRNRWRRSPTQKLHRNSTQNTAVTSYLPKTGRFFQYLSFVGWLLQIRKETSGCWQLVFLGIV